MSTLVYEPFEEDGELGVVRLDSDTHRHDILSWSELDADSPLTASILEMHKIWAFPKKPKMNTPLAELEGFEMENFDMEVGDYSRRFKAVSQRILQLFHDNFRFTDPYAEELLTAMVLDSYFKDDLRIALRLVIQGMPGSGKSKLLEVLAKISYRGWFIPIGASAASIYHSMGDFGVTPLIDELQDYDQDVRRVIDTIIKGGIVRGATISRTVPDVKRGWRTEFYSSYAPMTFVNQSGSYLRDEVCHRSFALYMVDMDDPTIPVLLDEDEITDIRTELYTLRDIRIVRPEWLRLDGLTISGLFEDTAAKLQNPPEGWPRLTGRSRDLATSAFTLARMQGTMDEMIQIFREKGEQDKSMFASGADGEVFNALASLVRGVEGILSHDTLGRRLSSFSTRDIARYINNQRAEDADGGKFEEIRTIVVTRKIKALGLTIETGQTNNLSMISASSEPMFLRLMRKYGTQQNQAYFCKVTR